MQKEFRPSRPSKGPDNNQRKYSQPQYQQPYQEQPPELEEQSRNTGAKVAFAVISLIFISVISYGGFWAYQSMNKDRHLASAGSDTKGEVTESIQALELAPNKNYGNKYEDGILPVGDGRYVTEGAKKGYVYLCESNFTKEDKTAQAVNGPWIVNNKQWDMNKKFKVRGDQKLQSSVHTSVANGERTMQSNGLPNHIAGNFPVNMTDPSYLYDRNPYSMKALSLSINLDAEPEYSETPVCMGEEAGMMLNGVILLNAFDKAGRDAMAWEVQDACDGHPHASGVYHYHKLSSCFKEPSISTVVGFALDGFPITGSKVGKNNYLTTDDLDECHGIKSDINLDGKIVNMYHYVLTKDFPYSVSCFRNTKAFAGGGGLAPSGGGTSGQQLNVQGSAQVQRQLEL